MQYDSPDNPYEQGQEELILPTSSWETACFVIPDGSFEGRQNHGADFRLFTGEGFALRKVSVSLSEPEGLSPRASARERIRKAMGNVDCPEGMEYTFGNDATETTAPLYRSLGVSSIESYVRRRPDHWLWAHRRWKTRPFDPPVRNRFP